MDLILLALLIPVGAFVLRSRGQKQRIALLGQQLGHYRIEKLMENLMQGYLRALGENDEHRRDQIWNMLQTAEQEIARQFHRFATDFARLDGSLTRVSRLTWAGRLFPQASFDLREVFKLHASGIEAAALNQDGKSPRDKAFLMTAELLLMQHSCHWFCRTKPTASARLQLRHQTSYAQVLASVSPQTRKGYVALTAR